ncbi:Uncharacterised protein [Campylobacter jejuni]|nr:Uncharacterised protein [Campylobacter jejuni]
MSLLIAATQKTQQAQQTVYPPVAMPTRLSLYPGRRMLLLIWLLGLPLAAGLGMASRYFWHIGHSKPVERRIDVPHPTPLPYRLLQSRLAFTTQPLPEPRDAMQVDATKLSESGTNQQGGEEETGTDELSERVMAAFAATKKTPSETLSAADSSPGNANSSASLPADLHGRIAAMHYNAHVYSNERAARVINLNGQDYHEGDKIVPGLKLVEIGPRDSVFSFEDRAFKVPALKDW